jgi:hypothetical protein
MKVTGLNGLEYILDLKKYSKQRSRCSSYHRIAREILGEKFKGYSVYEEVKLPGTVNPAKKSVLYLDFYVPNAKIGIEVHGEQHFKFVPFFHKTKAGFLFSQMRDRHKADWCEINEIELIVFNYSDPEEYWREQIECCC